MASKAQTLRFPLALSPLVTYGVGMIYVIETRVPASHHRAAGPWHSDGMAPEPITVESEERGRWVIEQLRQCGPDWEAAEYRVRLL